MKLPSSATRVPYRYCKAKLGARNVRSCRRLPGALQNELGYQVIEEGRLDGRTTDALDPGSTISGTQLDGRAYLPVCLVSHLSMDLVIIVLGTMRHAEYFHDHVRIERMFFDGVPQPLDGALQPDLSLPGFGVTFRRADAEPYRQKF